MHDVKLVTDVMDNAFAKRRIPYAKTKESRKRKLQHLCLDKAYHSKPEEQAIEKRGYVIHLPLKRKIGEVKKEKDKTSNRKNTPFKKMGCGENQFMAQQVQEAVHKI